LAAEESKGRAGFDRSFPSLIAGYALKTIIATRLALTLLFKASKSVIGIADRNQTNKREQKAITC
jgi:hypothetical protein